MILGYQTWVKLRAKQCYFHQIELRMCKNHLLFALVRRKFPIFASKLTCISSKQVRKLVFKTNKSMSLYIKY